VLGVLIIAGNQGDSLPQGQIRFIALIERVQRLVDQGLDMRIIGLAPAQALVDFKRFLRPIGRRKNGSLAETGIAVISFGLDGAFHLDQGLVMQPEILLDVGTADIGLDIIWLQRQGFFKAGHRRPVAVDGKKSEARSIKGGWLPGRQFNGAAMAGKPFLMPLHGHRGLAAAN